MLMQNMQGKREFLSKILYDDWAYTLPDEAINAGYCAYFNLPEEVEQQMNNQSKLNAK